MARSSCFKNYENCASSSSGPLAALDCAVDLLACLNKATGGRGGRRGGDRALVAALRGLQAAPGGRIGAASMRSATAGLQPAQAALLEDLVDLLGAINSIATKS